MQYLDCPRCRARFHTGVIYEPLNVCPRCGTSLRSDRPRLVEQLRAVLRRRVLREAPDWEAITGAQYIHRRATPPDPDQHGNTPATA